MPVPPAELRACPLFAGFTDTGLELFSQLARSREVPKGLPVFSAGNAGDALLIVVSGKVEIVGGKPERVLCELVAGESFGELALLRAGPRAVSARAAEPSRLLEIGRQDFNNALRDKPQACLKLMLAVFHAVEERLRKLQPELLGLL